MTAQQPSKKSLCCCTISPGLQKYINHFAILINSPPQVIPPAVYLDEDFVDVKDIAVAPMLSFQPACVDGAEFDAPKAYSFLADRDASFSQQVFDISMTEIETVVEANGVGNNIGWESVAFIRIHPSIIRISVA
jgi:hypothetical protein